MTTPAKRSRAYRDRKRGDPPRTLAPCGTTAAYARHLRHGEQPCDACRDDLRSNLGGEKRVVEKVLYETKINVTPNHVATKD